MQYGWVSLLVAVPFFTLLQALLLTVFNGLGRGSGTFQQYWSAAVNISVPSFGLSSLIAGVITVARGAESFTSIRSLQMSMPSLAWFAPDAGIKVTAALASITPFSLWGAGLAVLALLAIGRVPKLQAWLTGVLWIAIPALFAFATAR
jgi:hypothetical protein